MKFRHEWKHEINQADLYILRQRLGLVAEPDIHATDGRYEVRSLYFDTPEDKVLREKLDGVNPREKFRLRCYNGSASRICLEKKSKYNGLCAKQSTELNKEETQAIVQGKYGWMYQDDRGLVGELYRKITLQGLQPKTIVDYTREAFVYAPGNVRVTLDYNIRTGLFCTSFLDPSCITIPAGNAPVILEVKWDKYLPDIIRDAVQLQGRRTSSYSKYAACRIYG